MGRRLSRVDLGDRFSEGARLLWARLEHLHHSHADAARLLSVHPTRVHRIMYGLRLPSPQFMTAAQDAYGVPADSWGRPASAPFEPPASRDGYWAHPEE